jgi:hypothetical protein
MQKLLTTNNTKILKGRERGFKIYGLHLLPGSLCPDASPGCLRSCLNTAGHGAYRKTQEARARKTKFFTEDPKGFVTALKGEIAQATWSAKKAGLTPVFRLNLTSDVRWEDYGIPQEFSDYQFYDYAKADDRTPPDNYHLTFSRSESLNNHVKAKNWLAKGGNVAVVFKGEFPDTYWGHKVHSGENDDLRFLDPKPAIIGLKAKGKARKDTTGFVV